MHADDVAGDFSDAPLSAQANVLPFLATAYYEQNRLEEARAIVQNSMLPIDGYSALEIAFFIYQVRVFLEWQKSGPREALLLCEDLSISLQSRYGVPWGVQCQLLKRDILSRLSNDQRRDLGNRFVADVDLMAHDAWSPDLMEWYQLVVAREMLGEGRSEEALDMVRGIIPSAENDGRFLPWVQTMLIRALAQRALGDTRRAERSLVGCMARVASLGIRQTLLDLSTSLHPLAPFLQSYAASAQSMEPGLRELLHLLLAEMNIPSAAMPGERDLSLIEPLTGQETRILALLSERLTNVEMCEAVVLSKSTVKWHIYNLYQKLGVHSRLAALREGRLLGLLD